MSLRLIHTNHLCLALAIELCRSTLLTLVFDSSCSRVWKQSCERRRFEVLTN